MLIQKSHSIAHTGPNTVAFEPQNLSRRVTLSSVTVHTPVWHQTSITPASRLSCTEFMTASSTVATLHRLLIRKDVSASESGVPSDQSRLTYDQHGADAALTWLDGYQRTDAVHELNQ